jgi:hypothetical protein
MKSEPEPSIARIALLACSVFEREIELHTRGAQHIAVARFFEMGLHDRPGQMRVTLQAAMGELDSRDDIDALVLVYGLCGRGTAGLRPLRHKLVIPRAHDCITVFMGDKEAYASRQRRCPTCYYYTPGWNRGRRVPGPEKLDLLKSELAKRFDPEEMAFLIECEREQWARNNTAAYLDLGTADAETEADYARRCAEWLGWKFERLQGDSKLLRDLLWGNWDASRFQTIEPGEQLGQSPDEAILRSEPAETKATQT